jgi:hypothetical protein
MKSFLERIGVTQPDQPVVTAAPVAEAAIPVTQFVPVQISSDTPSVLDVAIVEAGIESQIQCHPDFAPFVSFSDSTTSLAAVIVDESTRFKAAQATSKVAKADLIAAVGAANSVIAAEQANFEGSFVANAMNEIQTVQAEEAAVTEQIQQLTEQLGQLSERKNALAKDSVSRTAELAKAKIDFASVVQVVSKRYADITTKLNQFLGA